MRVVPCLLNVGRVLWVVPVVTGVLLAGSCAKKREQPANLNVANKVSVRSVRLFYESPAMLLARRRVTVSQWLL